MARRTGRTSPSSSDQGLLMFLSGVASMEVRDHEGAQAISDAALPWSSDNCDTCDILIYLGHVSGTRLCL